MMRTAFLGLHLSPKWIYDFFFISLLCVSILLMVQSLSQPSQLTKLTSAFTCVDATLPLKPSSRLQIILNKMGLLPVAVIEDLHLLSSQTLVKEITHARAGIYMIVNLVTGDYYFGSGITNQLNKRFILFLQLCWRNKNRKHLITLHGNKSIAVDVPVYGLENFAYVLLMLTDDTTTNEGNTDLLLLETYYIKLFPLSYNVAPQGGNTFGYRHTEADLSRMRDNYSQERRDMIGALNRGRKFSQETIELIRTAALARPPFSDETREKCKTNRRPVTAYLLSDNSFFGSYADLKLAALGLNCGEKTIRRALKGTCIVKRTYIVRDS